MRDIGKCRNLLVPSDKTANFYEVSVILLNGNITKGYAKCNDKTLNDINLQTQNLTSNLKIHERIKNPLKNAYITVKNHKENFLTHLKCKLSILLGPMWVVYFRLKLTAPKRLCV